MTRLTILYHHRTRASDGQAVHIDELISAIRAAGHRVVVVEPRRVNAMATPIENRLLPKVAYELAEFAYSFVEFAKLAIAAIRYRPDALYERANLFMLSGLWISAVFRFPYLLEVNAPLAEERSRYGGLAWPKFAAWSERACWRAASVVLPVTAALTTYLLQAGVPAERIAVIPNGVDPQKFRACDANRIRERWGLGQSLVLGFAGYVRVWHGLDSLIAFLAARSELQYAHLLVIGDGPARTALEAQAKRLGVADRVHFTGTMPREALPELVASIDIALQPSVTPYASPLKLFEYMASARAIVAPATANIREIIEDGVDGILFTPDSGESMAEAVGRLAADPDLRARLGNAAAQKIRSCNLTWHGNAERVVLMVEKLRRPSRLAARLARN